MSNELLNDIKLYDEPIYFRSEHETFVISFMNNKVDICYDDINIMVYGKMREKFTDYENNMLADFNFDSHPRVIIDFKTCYNSCLSFCKKYSHFVGIIILNDNIDLDNKYKLFVFPVNKIGVYGFNFAKPEIYYSDNMFE